MRGNGKPDREQRNQQCRQDTGKITYSVSKDTHCRGDSSYETNMARPFRISEKFGWASEPIWEAWVVVKIKMHKENNHD